MENFYYNDEFYNDIGELIDNLELDEEEIKELPEDYIIEVFKGELQKIFTLEKEFVVDAIIQKTDTWEERFPEESDRVFKDIHKAIYASIDIDKLNSMLPELYYPGSKFKISKQELIDFLA